MKSVNTFVLYIFAIGTLAASACTAISPDQQAASSGGVTTEVTQASTGPSKLCEGFVPNSWSDTINVDDGWAVATCKNWANSIGATEFQLGCLFDNGYSWGAPNAASLPDPDCGWSCVPDFHGDCVAGNCNCGSGFIVGHPGTIDCLGNCVPIPGACSDVCSN